MKRIASYLVCTFLALALIGTLTTCVPELEDPRGGYADNGRLSISATVSDATVVTKAESVGALKEKDLNTLDIFVEHVTGTNGDGTFILQYHLPLSQFPSGVPAEARVIGDQVKSFLAERWSQEGLVFGEKYNIYVAANNTQTKGTKDLSTFNVAALKALVANEKEENIAVLDSDGNIGWKDGKTSGNIYKLYDANPGDARALSSEKEFMMDGVLKNWTPVAGSKDQVFGFTKTDDNIQSNPNQALILNRAAAKFVLNVKFDADFLKTLTQTKKIVNGVETWVDKPDEEKITITGSPAWKFYNFAFGAPVFTPETQGAGVELHNSGFNIFHNQSYTGDDKHFTITTYSYPNKWAEADYSTKAPSLVVSVGFTQNGVTNYHYYRIPLVKSTVTEIERNHIYVINATIATKGSTVQEDVTVTEDINYAVLPWNDETNSTAVHNDVQSIQHYYFNVNPKVYTLRGDGDQSVTLNYSKASGTKVNWKLFEIDPLTGAKGDAVVRTDEDAVWGWFYNSNGDMMTSYNDGSDWNHLKVTIEQSDEGTSGSKGTVTITSTALTNKAIKYMLLRVYLDEEATFDADDNPTMYEDILIRHFPTDNIQSFTGSWSSYHDADGSTKTITRTLYDFSDVQSILDQNEGATYTEETGEISTPISYSSWLQHQGEEGYLREPSTLTGRDEWVNAVPQNSRQGANSEANAYPSGDYYYWGTGSQSSWRYENNGYDWRTPDGWGYTYYRYTTLYRAKYTYTYIGTKYIVTYEAPSAGDWVDWDADAGQNVNREFENDHFRAKVFKYVDAGSYSTGGWGGGTYYWAADEYCLPIYKDGTITYRDPISSEGTFTNLTNNHMYVIQISSTSDKYVLGRPYVVNNVSQDNVVSPSFMIASQLGAVSYYSSADYAAAAAEHCARYMEVGTDGKRYIGWRLPTAAEISVIGEYQQGIIGNTALADEYRVISEVLGGPRYFSLDGSYVRIPGIDDEPIYSGGWNPQIIGYRHYLRCVRDLSAAEIEELNGFSDLQNQYQSR